MWEKHGFKCPRCKEKLYSLRRSTKHKLYQYMRTKHKVCKNNHNLNGKEFIKMEPNIKIKKESLYKGLTKGHMGGWKTWAAALIIGGGAVATAFGHLEIAKILYAIGGALGIVGIGHKIEKSGNHKILSLFLCLLFFIGCASPLNKVCKELTKAQEKLVKVVIIAQVAKQEDPNLVTEENIEKLIYLRDTISNLAGTACALDKMIPEKL